MAEFTVHEYLAESGVILLQTPGFEFEKFESFASHLVALLPATITEKQCDADLQTWLLDFEGSPLFLKAEHYTGVMWLEALSPANDREVMDFIARMLMQGISG